MSKPWRKSWVLVHRWIGLSAGLLFVLLGLTGSLLVFDHAIDEWLHPELLLTDGTGKRAALEEVVSAAEQTYAGPALSVSKPRVANGVWTVWFSSGTEAEPRFTAVYVDPYTTAVKGQRVWGEDLMSWIYRLHFRLVAGDIGATIVGIAGIVLMVSVCSGLYLWWPLWKRSWRAAFAVRRGARFNYDLHKATGLASAILLLVIAFTGVYMEFSEWFRGVVATFAEVTEPEVEFTSVATEGVEPLTADEALAIARERFPNAAFDHLHPPAGPEGAYEVAFRQAGEVQQSFGRSQVFLDQYSGRILAVRTPDDFTAADVFFAWQFPLHNGEAFGLVGRWVVFGLGLTPAFLYATGLLMWWRKRSSRRRQVNEADSCELPRVAELAPAARLAGSPAASVDVR